VWDTRVWLGPSVRLTARLGSLPTAKTQDSGLVVVRDASGAPVIALAPFLTPVAGALEKATTVSETLWPVLARVALIAARVNLPTARADQISDVPRSVLVRPTRA